MTTPIVEVKCFRCGTTCIRCMCAPCPKCEALICTSCPLDLTEIQNQHGFSIQAQPNNLKVWRARDKPIPDHGAPASCRPKSLDPIGIQLLPSNFFRQFDSYELLPAPAPEIVRSICAIFGFVAAGLVASGCGVMLAAAAVFSGELPE